MVIKRIKRLYDSIIEKIWLTEKPRARDNRHSQAEEDARAYEETLEEFRRKCPQGLRLYDSPDVPSTHGRDTYDRTTKDGAYDPRGEQ